MSSALVIGGGPAGLSFALTLKRRAPSWKIVVRERRPEAAEIGFGVTMPSAMLDALGYDDARWSVDTSYIQWRGDRYLQHDIDLLTIERTTFVRWLQRESRRLGVIVEFETDVRGPEDFDSSEWDVVVAADGVHSRLRGLVADARAVEVSEASTYHTWLAAPRCFDGLETIFREHEGDLFLSFVYPYAPALSTFIVECTAETHARRGFAEMDQAQTLSALEAIFAPDLDGGGLLPGGTLRWSRFQNLSLTRWSRDHIVLIGDAAHTANYAGGFGTLLALEDGITLAGVIADASDVGAGLSEFEAQRRTDVLHRQRRALSRHHWHARVLRDYEAGDAQAVERATAEARQMMESLARRSIATP